jgi:DNA-binding Lrp family transcriptional regulator
MLGGFDRLFRDRHRMALDAFDLKLLMALQEKGDLTQAELAERVCLSPSQCSRRLQNLREEGYIDRITALLSPAKLGLTLKVYVVVALRSHTEDKTREFVDFVDRSPQILECCMLTGDSDYLLKVVVGDLTSFDGFVQSLLHLPCIATVRSSIVLRDIKETTVLPLHMGSAASVE